MARGLTGKQYLDSLLNEQEQTYVKNFVDNDRMLEAVRKALLALLYEQGTIKSGKPADSLSNVAFALVSHGKDVTNEEVGADLRALWEAINHIEVTLENLKGYKTITERSEKKESNPAK